MVIDATVSIGPLLLSLRVNMAGTECSFSQLICDCKRCPGDGWRKVTQTVSDPSVTRGKWAATRQNQQNDCAPSEDSDQPGHPPSLIRVFAVRSMCSQGSKLSSCGQRRLWSDWADAQAKLSLRWAHAHFVGFVMSRLKWYWCGGRETKLVHFLSFFFCFFFFTN